MLKTALQRLTPENKAELRELGISDQLRSDWLHERKTPSQAQAAILETMLQLPEHQLRDWLTMQKATPAQRTWLEKAKGKALKHAQAHGVLPFVLSTVVAGAQHAWSRLGESVTMYIM